MDGKVSSLVTRTIMLRPGLGDSGSVGVKTGTSSSSETPSVRVRLSGFTPVLLQLIDLSEVAIARMSCILLTIMLQHLESVCMTTGILSKSSG